MRHHECPVSKSTPNSSMPYLGRSEGEMDISQDRREHDLQGTLCQKLLTSRAALTSAGVKGKWTFHRTKENMICKGSVCEDFASRLPSCWLV
ncbi:hypothetical protein ACOMHN_019884 [Nucella lapillus]